MTLQPYEISFLPSPRARKRRIWIRFAPTMERAIAEVKEAFREERMDYHQLLVRPGGQEAEARVHGVLRGGLVFRGRFYFHGPEPRVVDLEAITELELY